MSPADDNALPEGGVPGSAISKPWDQPWTDPKMIPEPTLKQQVDWMGNHVRRINKGQWEAIEALKNEHIEDQQATAQRRMELGAKIAVLQDQVDQIEEDLEVLTRRQADAEREAHGFRSLALLMASILVGLIVTVAMVAKGVL